MDFLQCNRIYSSLFYDSSLNTYFPFRCLRDCFEFFLNGPWGKMIRNEICKTNNNICVRSFVRLFRVDLEFVFDCRCLVSSGCQINVFVSWPVHLKTYSHKLRLAHVAAAKSCNSADRKFSISAAMQSTLENTDPHCLVWMSFKWRCKGGGGLNSQAGLKHCFCNCNLHWIQTVKFEFPFKIREGLNRAKDQSLEEEYFLLFYLSTRSSSQEKGLSATNKRKGQWSNMWN